MWEVLLLVALAVTYIHIAVYISMPLLCKGIGHLLP